MLGTRISALLIFLPHVENVKMLKPLKHEDPEDKYEGPKVRACVHTCVRVCVKLLCEIILMRGARVWGLLCSSQQTTVLPAKVEDEDITVASSLYRAVIGFSETKIYARGKGKDQKVIWFLLDHETLAKLAKLHS